MTATTDDKAGDDESDAVWMVSAGDEIIEGIDDRVASWLQNVEGGSESEYTLWTEDEVSGDDNYNIADYSPTMTDTKLGRFTS